MLRMWRWQGYPPGPSANRRCAVPAARTVRVMLLWLVGICSSILPMVVAVPASAGPGAPVALTTEERRWLDQHGKSLILYYAKHLPPIEMVSHDGVFAGLSADVIAMVERRLGVVFEKRGCDAWPECLAALENRASMVAPAIVRNADWERFAFFTASYVTLPVVIVSGRGQGSDLTLADFKGKRVAYVAGLAVEKYLRQQSQLGFEAIPMPDPAHGLRAAAFGQVDAFVEDISVAAYFIEKEDITNLRLAGRAGFSLPLSIGVSRDSPLLFSAVQKALASIPPGDFEALRKRWISLQVKSGISADTLRLIKLAALFVTLLLLGLAGISYLLKRRLNQELANLRQMEEMLRERGEFLKLATEASQSGAWEYRPAQGVIYFSEQWYLMLGYPPETRRGVNLDELKIFLHPEDWSHVRDYTKSYLSGSDREPIQAEFRLRRYDGGWCWVFSKGRVVARGADGAPTRIIGLDLNIQSIKDAREEIARSEARFRSLFISAPIPLANATMGGKIIAVNDRLVRTLGYTQKEIPDLDYWWRLVYPDPDYRYRAMSAWHDAVRRAVADGSAIQPGEYRLTCRDGSVLTMIVGATRIGDSFLISFFDITERKRAEEMLRHSEEKFSKMFMMAPDFIGITRAADGLITDVNHGFEKISGWKRSEVIGRTSLDIDFWVDPSARARTVEELTAGQEISYREIRFRRKDGTEQLGIFSALIITIAQEPYIMFILQDITDKRRLEEERRKLERQLSQSQKLEAVGVLAGGVAHDFNNMLGAILGYTELALDRIDAADPMRDYFVQILDAARRSADLTRQLLAFARKQTVAPVALDLNTAVEGTLKMLRRLIGENIELTWLPSSEWCVVKMDPSQLDQILANLCVNARDAITGVGKISIKTGIATFDEKSCDANVDCLPGNYVLLSVNDNGRGMDQDVMNHVFEPFFTTKGVGQGTGLGLATVYGIVKQNNGFINLYSEPGLGTAFSIYLPRHEADAADRAEEEKEVIPRSRGENILMVEDDPILREMGQVMLQRLGYNVLAAATPGEAIALVAGEGTQIQLFITDVIMPEMNGRELADRLLKIRPGMKHLFMSGYTADTIVNQGVLAKGVNFLQKPFSMKDLAFKIRAVLDRPVAGEN